MTWASFDIQISSKGRKEEKKKSMYVYLQIVEIHCHYLKGFCQRYITSRNSTELFSGVRFYSFLWASKGIHWTKELHRMWQVYTSNFVCYHSGGRRKGRKINFIILSRLAKPFKCSAQELEDPMFFQNTALLSCGVTLSSYLTQTEKQHVANSGILKVLWQTKCIFSRRSAFSQICQFICSSEVSVSHLDLKQLC